MSRRREWVDFSALRGEIESALRGSGDFPPGVAVDGSLGCLESGINHANYLFRIKGRGLISGQKNTAYVLRKLGEVEGYASLDDARVSLACEAETLKALARHAVQFSTPRFIAFVGDNRDVPMGFIETAVPGIPLPWFLSANSAHQRGMQVVSGVAAGIHRLPADDFAHLPRHPDARAHILARLEPFESGCLKDDRDFLATVEWIQDHLPTARPAVLLHGDLLPQNLLVEYDGEKPGVVDWEYARIGDPAYDFAIVTRGNRKILREAGGVGRLVDLYRAAGGVELTRRDVTIHELILVLGWLRSSVQGEREGTREGHPPEFHRDHLRAILRRARGGGE